MQVKRARASGKLWHRVFFASMFAVLLAVAILSFAQQAVFKRSFVDYLNQRERESADALIDALREEYRRFGWERLRGNPQRFNTLVNQALPGEKLPPTLGPPPPRPGSPRQQDGRDLRQEAQRPPPPKRRPPPAPPRFALVDPQRESVTGTPLPLGDAEWLEINVDGSLVGYLSLLTEPGMRDQVDLAFAQTQQRSIALTASLVLLLLLPASWWWSRKLAMPLSQLADNARRVGSGDYSARVRLERSDEIGALSESFNRMAEALEQGRTARQRWTAEISHELRTPIAILRAEIEAMQDGVRASNSDTLGSLAGEVERLSALIDDLYQLASADAGALNQQLQQVDLVTIVQQAIAAQKAALDHQRLQIESRLPANVYVQGDGRQLRQLLDNLLVNALRYVPQDGRVRLSLIETGKTVELIVEDDGPGVADGQLHQLFDPLFRADPSRSREYGGSGLGLALVQRLAQAHGARAEASRSPMGGLRIAIRGLPR